MSSSSRPAALIAVLSGIALVLAALLLLNTDRAAPPPRLPEVASPRELPAAANATAATEPIAARSAPVFRAAGPITLAGAVRSRTAVPVADAFISFAGADKASEVRTDARGEFVVTDILAGNYQVVVMGPHLLTHSEFVEVTAEPAPLLLIVDQGALLSGQVVDELQRPLQGARVTPWRRGSIGETLDPRCAVTTDVHGGFQLRGDANGFTFVFTEHAGFAAIKSRLDPSRVVVVQLQRAQK